VEQPQKPPSERDLFFRPVSVTLYCVMGLTLQSVLVHTGVAIAKNSDELSAATEPSFATQVLETAARSVPLAPMMSLLFVANRIYMLESSNGLGEVELWVKLCIMAAALGMAFQLCTVVLLALTTVKGDQRFSDTGGDVRDAHPHISSYSFHSSAARSLNLALQSGSILGVYGGVGGVVLGMIVSGRGVDPESAAVCCTAAVVVLYFAVQLALWATNTGVLAVKKDKCVKAVRDAALRGDAVVQKAPMFAVLILSTRLRQVQEGIPGGTPPQLVCLCFVAVVVTLYLEVFISPFTSGVLDEDAEGSSQSANLGTSVRLMNYVQGSVAILGLVAAWIIASDIIKPWGVEKPLDMSPTVQSVMALCLVFFLVHFLITVYGLVRGVLRLTASRAQDALLNARNSVGFCPLLCVLFLGCRMRALQITGNKGMPQWWEQDFLYLCVGATVIEVVCCITRPAFYKEVGVDAEGNPTYDIQSLAGAYTVTVVRYLALLGLHSGILGICVSVFTMTPETATGIRPDAAVSLKAVARAMVWSLVALMIACVLSSAKVVGLMVKLALESVDEVLLNAEVTVDAAVLSLWRGHVVIKGLVVSNPLGTSFKSDFLFRVDIAAVKINLWRLIKSLAADIEIGEIVLNGVTMNYELGANSGPSNVGLLLEFLDSEAEQPAPPPKPRRESVLDGIKRSASNLQQSASNLLRNRSKDDLPEPPPPPPASGTSVVLHRIFIKNVHALVLHPTMGALVGVDLGKIDIDDFSKKSKGRQVGQIVAVVLKTVIRTAMTNADIVKHLLHQGTSHVISSVAEKVKGCGQSCAAGLPRLSRSKGCFAGTSKEAKENPPAMEDSSSSP